jgi:hypothetical protein
MDNKNGIKHLEIAQWIDDNSLYPHHKHSYKWYVANIPNGKRELAWYLHPELGWICQAYWYDKLEDALLEVLKWSLK